MQSVHGAGLLIAASIGRGHCTDTSKRHPAGLFLPPDRLCAAQTILPKLYLRSFKKFDLEADFVLSKRTEDRYFVSYKCFSLFVMSRFCLFRLKVPVQGRGASAHWRAIAGGRSHLSSCGCQVPITPAIVSGKGCNSVLDVQKKEDVAPSFPNGVRKMR